MSAAIYDNWERLVSAALEKDVADSVSSSSSAFSFCHLISSPDDLQRSDFDDSRDFVPELGESSTKLFKCVADAKQQSYPLPLPPRSISPPKSPKSVWKKGRLIYKGVLGGVYCGFDSVKGGMCAMKEVSFSFDGDRKHSAMMLEHEIALLSRMRHPNVVQYYGSEMVADRFYIYFEYMSRGSIFTILEQFGRLGESAIRSYTQQILSGLAYLNSNGVVHGDIKGANILLDPTGIIKLTNFGIEKQIAEKFRIAWLMDSPYWMAPEVIMNANVHDFAVDIWSLGCTVLEMATAKPPLSQYDGAMAIFKVAYRKELPTIPDHLSDACKDFLRNCLQWNPLHRATACQLLEHPFVKGSWPLKEHILVSTSSAHLHQLEISRSNFNQSDIYTPRKLMSPPTSPMGSGLVHPRSPPPPQLKHTVSGSSAPVHQESFGEFPKKSHSSSSPFYWDPNILQPMFR